MNKRVMGIVVAAVLAIVGTLLIVSYTEDASDRNAAGGELADVLVATSFVPAGTPVDQLGGAVALRAVPVDLVLDGAVADLAALEGLVAATDLQANQQLSFDGFGPAAEVERLGEVEVPEGLIETSFTISPDRSIGGAVRPGDTITILVAFDAGEQPANTVSILFSNVLVTGVQGDQPVVLDAADLETGGITPLPSANSLITVALDGPDASRLVYAVEFGRLYLALEPLVDADVVNAVITAENVLR